MLITLGEGDKAQRRFLYLRYDSTTRVLRIRNGNFILTCIVRK